ncbi:membrane protein [Planotetraspora silvatica]|uniref:Membrane protein n=1 Tax=Planotetraspora silvatica TaxID=234614 RepID=A0A8J3XMG3_9ACTN|nr:membrane protein [Planotetraspora silvatica]
MAGRLYGLGHWAARRRGRVVLAWLLLLTVVGALGVTLSGKLATSFSVPGIESQKAQDLLTKEFPAAAGGTARVVFAAPAGSTLDEPGIAKALTAGLEKAQAVPGVERVSNPAQTRTISADKRIGYADVVFREAAADVPESAKDELTGAMEPLRAAGAQVDFGGSVMTPKTEVGGPGEIAGVVVAFVVLAVALGSLVAAGLPLLTALAGVGVGVLGVQFLSRFVEMTSTATILALMIGLAVGIDYALFVITRHREQLAEPGSDVHDSIARATATAGSAVAFAGITVVIALSALASTGIPFLAIMGLAAAATVLISVAVALTLLPALLAYAGERLRPRPRTRGGEPGAWGLAWARVVTRRPVLVLLVGTVALLAVAVPALNLRLGLPGNQSQPAASTQHRSYDLLSEGFGPGFNAALSVVVADVPADRAKSVLTELHTTLAADGDVAAVAPPVTNGDGTVAVIGVVPKTGPDDQATTDLVLRLRADHHAVTSAGGTMYVAGTTAAAIDLAAKLSGALPVNIGIIVVLALILLMLAFRSVLVPVKAVLGFLLSIAASLGAVVWVFQEGHLGGVFQVAAAAPLLCFLPVLLIGVLFGLAMDYEVFLVSRIREHYAHTGNAREAIHHGLARSGRVVSSAALIMAAVFGGFIFSADPIIKSIGFALTVGVLIDAFVVRLTLVPAAMALLGARAWRLPRLIDRVLPHVDVEGGSHAGSAAQVHERVSA